MNRISLATLLILGACGSDGAGFNKLPDDTGETVPDVTTEPTTPTTEPTTDPTTAPTVPTTAQNADEPVAVAQIVGGGNQTFAPLDRITLTGENSHDNANGGQIVEYRWTVVGPNSSNVYLESATDQRPDVFLDLAGLYSFSLEVKNNSGVWDSTPDVVQLEAVAPQGFYVELSWDASPDLDLHMFPDSETLFSTSDVCYCNPEPNWGVNGTNDDPSLDYDVQDGFGPETTTNDAPPNDTYKIKVHYYGDGFGAPTPTIATARIYVDGIEQAVFTHELNAKNQLWNVATVNWNSAQGATITAPPAANAMETTSVTNCF